MTAQPLEIEAELERILASPTFSGSARSVQFLRFCVEQSLLGNDDQIKETTVAVQVFGRSSDYDPRTDPIVRVHARRLRERLELYYETHGANDPVQISLPKGTYVPHAVRVLPRTTATVPESLTPPGPLPALLPVTEVSPPISPALIFTRSSVLWASIVLLTVGAIIYIAAASALARRATALHIQGEVLPLNSYPGREQTPSFSPDGRQIAFAWNGGGLAPPGIYLQRIGDSQTRRLTHSPLPELRPIWSADGHQVAFLRYIAVGEFAVIRTALETGQESTVGTFSFNWLTADDPPALDWSPDGRSLLVAEQPSSSSPVRLIRVDLASGIRSPLTSPPSGNSGDIDGRFSPDGSLIAFRRGGLGDLYVVPATGESHNNARRLTPNNPGVRGLAWSRDGSTIFFGSMEGGHGWGIWQIRTDGSRLAPVLTGSLNLINPAVSPDGSRIATEQQDIVTNLVELDPAIPGSVHPFAPSNSQDYSPAFSPDGSHIAFVSTRSGAIELWLADSSGTAVRQLTQFQGDGFVSTPSWSADSKTIFFAIRHNGSTNIASIPASGGQFQELTSTPDRNINPVSTPDGRFIYFNSNQDGTPRIWRIPTDRSTPPEQMFWDAPWSFQISSDTPGRNSPQHPALLFRTSSPQLEIARRDLATGALRTIFRSSDLISEVSNMCVHDDTTYLVVSPATEPFRQDLVAVNMRTGKARTIEHFGHALPAMQFGCSTSPDGYHLLVPAAQRFDSDIYIASLSR